MSNDLRIDTNWHYHGFRAVVVENRLLRLVVLPELGGKLWSLVYKPADRELFWHNPRQGPRPAPYGAAYDDWFCGGWDELFPNDAPTSLAGDAWPDHGEWWAMPFEWAVEHSQPDAVTVILHRQGVVTNTSVERRITVRAGDPRVTMHYRLHNAGPQPLDYLWKLHPALAVSPHSRIDLPACRVQPDPAFNDRIAPQPFAWPLAQGPAGSTSATDSTPDSAPGSTPDSAPGSTPDSATDSATVDMRRIPDPADYSGGTCDFYYATELAAGWCALTDTQSGTGLGLAFDPAVLRSVWVFGAYGGWRGHYTTVLEPCTGYPYRLEEAVAQGTASRLEPGQTIATTVTAVLYSGRTAVNEITPEGEVR